MSLTKTPPYSHARLRAALAKTALKAAFGAAVAIGVLGAGQAQALVVNVGGKTYDVTTFLNSNTFSPQFALPPAPGVMPWWNNQTLAAQFASAVGSGLGTPNGNGRGAFFGFNNTPAFNCGGAQTAGNVCSAFFNSSTGTVLIDSFTGNTRVWAQATELVPGPLPALGAAAAFGFSRKLRNRIKASKAVGASFTAA